MNSALYPCTITHVRTAPRRYALRHRTYLWLIDPDRPPELPALLRPLAGFDARDHFGGTAPTVRAGLERFLRSRGSTSPTAPSPCSPRPGSWATCSTP